MVHQHTVLDLRPYADNNVVLLKIQKCEPYESDYVFLVVLNSTNPSLFSQSSPSSTFLNEHFLFVEGGQVRFQSYHSSPNWTTVVSSETIPNKTWVHVAMTHEEV